MFERHRVIRKRLFRDHIPHQNDEQLVRQRPGGLPEPIELLHPVFGGQVREEVGWLPGLLNRGRSERFCSTNSCKLSINSIIVTLPKCLYSIRRELIAKLRGDKRRWCLKKIECRRKSIQVNGEG